MRTAVFIGGIALATASAPSCNADDLIIRDGNVVLVRRLTSGGQDSYPVMAADGRTAYFVRTIPDPEADKQWDGAATQILSMTIPEGKLRILVNPAGSEKPENNLRGFEKLTLSHDGRTLLYICYAWATSGALHVLNLATGATSYLTPGNDLMIVANGQYQGDLVVQKHRYMVAGGSHDFYWLLTPSGKELGMVAETKEQAESVVLGK